MKLSTQRLIFTDNICALIDLVNTEHACGPEYRLVLGEVQRSTEATYGHPNSLHKQGLAADLHLYINDVYQRTTEAHAPIGRLWKSLHPDNKWGGDFRKKDGNHYSMTRGGIS